MIFQASLEAIEEGEYLATCSDPMATATGLSPTSALESLRAEIRYRIELCPCSGVEDDFVELEFLEGGSL